MIKKALGTHDKLTAQACAIALFTQYAQLFAQARGLVMSGVKLDANELAKTQAKKAPRTFELEITPQGFRLKTDGTDRDAEKGQKAMESALDRIGILKDMMPHWQASSPPKPTPLVSAHITLGEAAKKYLLTLDAQTVKKTKSQKAAAVNGLAEHKGKKTPLSEVTRTDVLVFFESLRLKSIQTPTLANKQSYIKAFFAWAQNAGYYPQGDNPAVGQIVYRTREKKQRRRFGFRPFTPEQLKKLYSVESLSSINLQTRWGALIGLYSGSRATEVGQLALSDFAEKDGVWCYRITNEGEGQSVKNDASLRWVPIHPDLIELGLLDQVKALRAAGKTLFFPRAKLVSVNGRGNWLSKSFSRYREILGKTEGKLGFHSLRKNMIQKLQDGKVSAEYRAQYAGHALDDEHFEAYSRSYTMKELADMVHPALDFGLDVVGLKRVMKA